MRWGRRATQCRFLGYRRGRRRLLRGGQRGVRGAGGEGHTTAYTGDGVHDGDGADGSVEDVLLSGEELTAVERGSGLSTIHD